MDFGICNYARLKFMGELVRVTGEGNTYLKTVPRDKFLLI